MRVSKERGGCLRRRQILSRGVRASISTPNQNKQKQQVRSDEGSPLIHVGLDPALGLSPAQQKKALRSASRKCVDAGYAIGMYIWVVV